MTTLYETLGEMKLQRVKKKKNNGTRLKRRKPRRNPFLTNAYLLFYFTLRINKIEQGNVSFMN